MSTKLFIALATTMMFATAVAGQGPKVKTHRITGGEPANPAVVVGGAPPATFSLGPGDSIGFTYYDYGSNGSANRNLINFGDGQFSFARMCAVDPISAGTATRGSYFKFFDGTSWSTDWLRVETVRRGWTNIDQFSDFGGVEGVITHITEFNVDAARGANVWTPTVLTCAEGTWPRVAIGNGFTVHAIGTSGPTVIGYHSSPDAGVTWTCDQILYTSPGVIADADGYDITADGDKVAIVIAGIGGDVVLLESMDNGATWTESVVYDIDESLGTPGEEVPDGTVTALYDASGNLHIAWANFVSNGDGSVNFSTDAGIRHWSAASGVQEVAYPDPNPALSVPGDDLPLYDGTGYRDGNLATEPDLSADASGGVYIIFNRIISEQDDSLRYYQHIFATKSTDGGTSWSASIDITPGTGFDASYGTVADLTDEFLHFAYFCDAYAGNALNGAQPNVEVAAMIHRVPSSLTGVKEIPGVLPEAYRLEQNYPNPFNPTTNIRYSIPEAAFVTLKVYDVLGREVATLINQDQDAGSYVVDFGAEGLANGTYYYKLSAGSFAETKKMVVLK
jgi:hypothetical protein